MRDLFFTFLIAFSASIISIFPKPFVRHIPSSPAVLPAETSLIVPTPTLIVSTLTPVPIATPTSTPTPSPTSTPVSTPNPTSYPQLTNTPASPSQRPSEPAANPTATQKTSSQESTITTDIKSDYVLNKINEYRSSKGLAKVEKDSYTCDFAKKRAKEISTNFNHDDFKNNLPYPGYSLIAENIAQNGDYKKVADGWIASSGHRENLEKDVPYGCVGNEGNYFAYEAWKP